MMRKLRNVLRPNVRTYARNACREMDSICHQNYVDNLTPRVSLFFFKETGLRSSGLVEPP